MLMCRGAVLLLLLLAVVAATASAFSLSSLTSLPGKAISSVTPTKASKQQDDGSKSGGNILTKLVDKAVNTTSKVVSAVVPNVNGTTYNTFKALFTTVGSCIGSMERGWEDEELGDFTVGKESPYCNSACSRDYFCCAPQRPEELTVNFFFSGKRGQHYELRLNDSKSQQLIRQNPKLVWIIHGLGNDITSSDQIFNKTRDAYLDRGYSVVLVDWHKGNRLYNQAMANVRIVGALTGQMMLRMGVAGNSLCAGFSLGSHVCGEAGSWVKKRGGKLARCIGIDPAGPGFDGCSSSIRLDKKDCGVVTSIHTSQFKGITSIPLEEGLGTKEKTGHCDFWANMGKEQPTCDNTTIGSFAGLLATGQFKQLGSDIGYSLACSHSRGMQYFFSQVSHTCNFRGVRAECGGGAACTRADIDDEDFDDNGQPLLQEMPLPPDDKCDTRYDADFTFDTTGKEPFC